MIASGRGTASRAALKLRRRRARWSRPIASRRDTLPPSLATGMIVSFN